MHKWFSSAPEEMVNAAGWEEKKNDKMKEFVLRICLQLLMCLVKSVARTGDSSGVSDPSQHSVVCVPACCIQVVLEGPGKAASPKTIKCVEQAGILSLVSTSLTTERTALSWEDALLPTHLTAIPSLNPPELPLASLWITHPFWTALQRLLLQGAFWSCKLIKLGLFI